MRRPIILLLTHGLALALGWMVFRGPELAGPAPGNDATARETKRSHTAELEEGRRVLAEMRQGWGTGSHPEERQPQSF